MIKYQVRTTKEENVNIFSRLGLLKVNNRKVSSASGFVIMVHNGEGADLCQIASKDVAEPCQKWYSLFVANIE